MADINVDVNLPSAISVDITSPTQALAANISIPGPQGPRGEKGNPTSINSLTAENIIITGVDGNVAYASGTSTIFISGNSGYFQSAVNSLTTNLNNTGANLNTSINNLSGLFTGYTGTLDSTYATDSQLNSTGSNLENKIISLSGTLTGNYLTTNVASSTYATINNLNSTGSTLNSNINSLSGTLTSNYATITNLGLTGSTLSNNINSLSGTLTSNYATITNLDSTGSTLTSSINSLNSVFTGFTGNLDATYATDSQLASTGTALINTINSLSGTITGNYVTKSNGQFTDRPTVNGTGVLLSGEAAALPTTILYTTGNQIKSGRLIIGDTIVDASYPYTLSLQSNTQETWLEILNHSGANQGVFFGIAGNNFEQWNSQAGDILFVTSENPMDGTERLRIKNDGKVGIGTNSPSEKLEVAGNIIANNLVYNTGNQTVSGAKTFTEDLVVQKSGFFWSGIKIGLNSIIITEESIKISGDPVIVRSTFTGYTGDVVNTYATITNVASTGSTLSNSINSLSGTLTSTYATISNLASTGSNLQTQINNLDNVYATDTSVTNVSNNLASTGSTLDSKINSLSGSSVLLYGDQSVGGIKTFRDNVYINNLFVTGAQTVVSTNNFTVQSPYLLLNLTGGAVDGGIFFVTGSGLTGVNDNGPIIGFDHSNKFKFGVSTRNSDLSTLPDIASVQDITAYSGFVDGKYSTIINLASTGSTLSTNLASTGSTLQTNINNLSNTYATITNLALTGSTLVTNLASTESTLNTKINNLSGYINSSSSNIIFTTGDQNITGVKTFNDDVYLQGETTIENLNLLTSDYYFDGVTIEIINSSVRVSGDIYVSGNKVLTGVDLSSYATKTNLASTGSTLDTKINNLSGYVTGTNSTFTTNLASTGSTLNTKINNLSGYINSSSSNIVFTTGNQTISGIKSFAQDTTFGDSAQGDFLVISGNQFTVYGSGNFTSGLFVNGNAVLTGVNLSSYATITNLANTGSTLDSKINNLSGYVNSSSSNIVFTTGNQTISGVKTFIGNHNISGNLNVTGNSNIRGTLDVTGLVVSGLGTSFILKSPSNQNSVFFEPTTNGNAGALFSNYVYSSNMGSRGDDNFSLSYGGGGARSLILFKSVNRVLLDSNGNFGIGSGISSVPSRFYVSGDSLLQGNLKTSGSGIFTSGLDLNNSNLINATPQIINLSANFNISGNYNSRMIMVNSATEVTGNIISGNSLGFNVSIIQIGAGKVFITGITNNIPVLSYSGLYRTAGIGAAISVLHTGNNGYIMYGNTV